MLKWRTGYKEYGNSLSFPSPAYFFEDASISYPETSGGNLAKSMLLKKTLEFLDVIKKRGKYEPFMKML